MVAPRGGSERIANGEPRVTFAHFSDLHLGGDKKNLTLARQALSHKEMARADMLVVSGDLSDHGREDELEQACALLKPSPVKGPVLAVPGNHDLGTNLTGVAGPLPHFFGDHRGRLVELAQTQDGCACLGRAGMPWPVRVELLGGRVLVYGLDSAGPSCGRLDLACGRLDDDQLDALDGDLAARSPEQRAVVVLHHHVLRLPLGRQLRDLFQDESAMALQQPGRSRLLGIVAHRRVDLVLHGHRHHFLRRRHEDTHIVSASSTTAGDGLTGQRFFGLVSLGLQSGAVEVERVQYADPAHYRVLAELVDARETMAGWIDLAERACQSEDSFVSFATSLADRAFRMRLLDGMSRDLDGRIEVLLRRADVSPSEPAPAAGRALWAGRGGAPWLLLLLQQAAIARNKGENPFDFNEQEKE